MTPAILGENQLPFEGSFVRYSVYAPLTEETSFENPHKEPTCQETGKVMRGALKKSHGAPMITSQKEVHSCFFFPKDSPSHHHHRQHSPSAKPLQQQVRRQIKGAERDVENSQDNAVLVSHQAKVFVQAVGLCISQVGSVEIVEEVHERQNRQQSTVAIVSKHVSSQGRHKYLKSSFLTTDRSTTGSITKDPAMETPASEIEGLLVFCRSDLDEVGSAMTVLPVMRLQGEIQGLSRRVLYTQEVPLMIQHSLRVSMLCLL